MISSTSRRLATGSSIAPRLAIVSGALRTDLAERGDRGGSHRRVRIAKRADRRVGGAGGVDRLERLDRRGAHAGVVRPEAALEQLNCLGRSGLAQRHHHLRRRGRVGAGEGLLGQAQPFGRTGREQLLGHRRTKGGPAADASTRSGRASITGSRPVAVIGAGGPDGDLSSNTPVAIASLPHP